MKPAQPRVERYRRHRNGAGVNQSKPAHYRRGVRWLCPDGAKPASWVAQRREVSISKATSKSSPQPRQLWARAGQAAIGGWGKPALDSEGRPQLLSP